MGDWPRIEQAERIASYGVIVKQPRLGDKGSEFTYTGRFAPPLRVPVFRTS